MLERCHAYLIGSGPAQTRLLESVAERLGFASFTHAASGDTAIPADATVTFFLVHIHLPAAIKKATLTAIRTSARDTVRFAPVILIADDCDFETVLAHVHLGYDDVVSLPEKRPILAQRLESQINTDHIYIQTSDYLGPDRRRLDVPGHHFERRGHGDNYYERLIIHRSLDAGITVVQRQVTV